jgi:acyl-CoA dehydrogenase
MAWDFCADPDFQPTLDWITGFISDEVQPLEPLLPQLSAQEAGA